jgi:hypothetical protein
MSRLVGSEHSPLLAYWINEREKIRLQKEAGFPPPWSDDPVFQRTYFCNVHREDDRVTKFIRRMYSPRVRHYLFPHNIILSRFLNWPDTLDALGYIDVWDPSYVQSVLNGQKVLGKVWGNAYVVTTHGIKMDKIDYLCDRVMPSIAGGLSPFLDSSSCEAAAKQLQTIEGISTFMAGQVVADLKNTPGHPLQESIDWWDFVVPGPGSLRGLGWYFGQEITPTRFQEAIDEAYREVIAGRQVSIDMCMQDFQNCLCEYDKYMRVHTGTGRSKRNYNALLRR